MKRFVLGKRSKFDPDELKEMKALLEKGGVLVVPTDTSYGMAALISKEQALNKVFELKGRDKHKTSSIAVKDQKQAFKHGKFNRFHKEMWNHFLPGPLTIILPAKKALSGYITAENRTIGFRHVDHPVLQKLLEKVSAPITITSANKSGDKEVYSYRQFMAQYKEGLLPDGFVDLGALPKRRPSTVIRIDEEGNLDILREGGITKKRLQAALACLKDV